MPSAYAYLRVSHEQSAISGAGIAAQETTCQAMFDTAASVDTSLWWGTKSHEHQRAGFFHDSAISAFRIPFGNRPAGKALLAALKKGDTLLVSKADRMFRSMPDMVLTLEFLRKKKVTVKFGDIHLDTSTPIGELMLNVVVLMAQWESRVKGQRIKEANAIRKAMADQNRNYIPKALVAPGEAEKHTLTRSDPDILSTVFRKRMETPPPAGSPGRIFLYVRCSHLDSAESGLGLAWQRQACRAYAERLQQQQPNLTIVERIYEDEAVSAWKHRFALRPEGRLLAAELRPGDHVVFARLDRAFRSTRDMGETLPTWQDRGISAHFAADNIDLATVWGRAVVAILAVFAQIEPELTSVRTREALAELRQSGRGMKLLRGFKWVTHRGVRSMVPDRRAIALMRLSAWCHNCRGMGRDRIAALVERLIAKRENRPVIPSRGLTVVEAGRLFGNDKWRPYLSVGHGKYEKLVQPIWHSRDAADAWRRYPLIQEYLMRKRAEATQDTATLPAWDPVPSRSHS